MSPSASALMMKLKGLRALYVQCSSVGDAQTPRRPPLFPNATPQTPDCSHFEQQGKKRTYTECFPLRAGSSFNLEEERDVH